MRVLTSIMERTKEKTNFKPGDTIRVNYKIVEGEKTRIQPFEGVVLSLRGRGVSQSFLVRKLGVDGIGVERIFPLYSPNIVKIEVVKSGRSRRAKLYYLRKRVGRSALKVESA